MTRLKLVDTAHWIDAAVVVPTLNEGDNIGDLLDGILAADARLHVIVVDDGSTDGTTELVAQRCADGTGRVHLLARGRKMGYASAVQDGMRYALARGARLVLQMDADLSHDPADLPALVAGSEEHDLVVGSRYVRGGGTRHWSLKRRLLSRGANALVRTLLGLPVHDCTGGFRCWQADMIEACGALNTQVLGYAFLFMTLDRCRHAGARIGEVPIIFTERRSGQSKMSGGIIEEAARALFGLWWQRLTRPAGIEIVSIPSLEDTAELTSPARRVA